MLKRLTSIFYFIIKYLQPLGTYATRRPFTITALIFSIICLIFLILSLRGYFRIDTSHMEIGILPATEAIRIDRGTISLHKGSESDELMIQASFSVINPSGDKYVTIKVPETFKLNNESFKAGFKFLESWVRKAERYYSYVATTTEGVNPYLQLKFNGSAFRSHAREIDFTLFLNLVAYNKPPIYVTISGLDRSDINYPSPEPHFRRSYAIGYNPLRWDSPRSLEIIKFHMRDRESGLHNDFLLFMMGIIGGIIASLFASILWEMIREKEIRSSKKT